MFRHFLLAILGVSQLHAVFFDYWGPVLSEKAKKAQEVMLGFDEIIQKAIDAYNIPGLAIGVVVDGQVVYGKGFGVQELEKKLPVNTETLFAIGSCTKAFTSFLMGTLVDEGMLHWDQKVIDILPTFRLWDPYATRNLSIRDLLTHRSGMPRHDFMWYNSTMTRQEVVDKLRFLEPSCEIRERYQYNNLMYLTAGYAMEKVMGKTWEELVKERILDPLEMKSTNFSIDAMAKSTNVAYPHIEKDHQLKKVPFRNITVAGPAGSMNSNIVDLLQWIRMHLEGGVLDQKTLISPTTLQEMHSPQVVITGAPEVQDAQIYACGIGWKVASYKGHYFVTHDGGIDGFTSVVGLFPQDKIGFVILTNKNLTILPRYLSLQIVDKLLGLPYKNWIQEGIEAHAKHQAVLKENEQNEESLRKFGTAPSHELNAYVGDYVHPGYGVLSIGLQEGQLSISLNGITSLLGHWHYDVFVIAKEMEDLLFSREGSWVTFQNNVHGDVEELVIPFEPNVNPIVFKKKIGKSLSTLSYLRQFIGCYEIYGYTVEVVLRNEALYAIIPGEPVFELVPQSNNEFTVKSISGASVRFVMAPEGDVKEVLVIQPYGTFSAKPKVVQR